MPGGWGFDDDELDEGSRRDAENAVRQAQRLTELIREHVENPRGFELTRDLLCELNRLAVDGRTDNPGVLRTRDVVITSSRHHPPPFDQVPALVDALCAHVNASDADSIDLAAFVMWRVNWIHPFEEGNGRTARAASYLVLSVGLGRELPGEKSLIERCIAKKKRYIRCLEAADAALRKRGRVDVSELSAFLAQLLKAQLADHVAGEHE